MIQRCLLTGIGLAIGLGMKTTILIPLDFSEPSLAALQYATTLAKDGPAKLVLLHVVDRSYPIGAPDEYAAAARIERIIAKEAAEAKRQLEEHAARLRRLGLEVEIANREGKPAAEILKAAKSVKAKLIAMGTHGRTGLRRLLIGSVAEAVIRGAGCPVLTVRSTPRPTKQNKKAA